MVSCVAGALYTDDALLLHNTIDSWYKPEQNSGVERWSPASSPLLMTRGRFRVGIRLVDSHGCSKKLCPRHFRVHNPLLKSDAIP